MRRQLAAGMALIICCCPWQWGMAEEARALAPVQTKEPTFEVLDEVLVTGTQPGPALWQVKSGTNVLWILASPPLVSKSIKWRSKQVKKVLADTQEVLAVYGTGFIPKSELSPRELKALSDQSHYLPPGQTLRDILPPDLYVSFETAKVAFPDGDKNLEKGIDIDRSRPNWARNLLSQRARQALKLGFAPVTDDVVSMAKRRKVKVTSIEYLSWSGYQPLPQTIEAAMDMCQLDDLLQNLESRGARWKARANAWAVGDVKRLKDLIRPLTSRLPQCKVIDVGELPIKNKWLDAMERSLADNSSTLAVVDASLLLSAGGLLDELMGRGYEVMEP
jgi:hypothetical protein